LLLTMKASFVVVLALIALSVSARPHFGAFADFKAGKLGKAVFTPAKLPCAFTIFAHVEYYVNGQLKEVYNMNVSRDGDLVGVFETDANGYTWENSVRYDLAYQQSGYTMVPVYTGQKVDSAVCVKQDLEKTVIDEQVAKTFQPFTEVQTFDSVEKASYKGKKCDRYIRKDQNEELQYFVDSNNYLVGVVENEDVGVTIVGDVSYAFDVPMSNFVMLNIYPGCDADAYKAPKEQCGASSSTSGSTSGSASGSSSSSAWSRRF